MFQLSYILHNCITKFGYNLSFQVNGQVYSLVGPACSLPSTPSTVQQSAHTSASLNAPTKISTPTNAPPASSLQLPLTPKSPIPGWTVVGTLAPGVAAAAAAAAAVTSTANTPANVAPSSQTDAAMSIINNAIASLNNQSAQQDSTRTARNMPMTQRLQLQNGVLTLTNVQPEPKERLQGVRCF